MSTSAPLHPPPRLIAHRGAPTTSLLENTVEAFQQAITMGCDGVELDVRCARDGTPLVVHGETIAGAKVFDLSTSEAYTRSGGIVRPLDDVLSLISPAATVLVEFKRVGTIAELDAAKSIARIAALHPQDVWIISFDHWFLRAVKSAEPVTQTGLLLGTYEVVDADVLRRSDTQFVDALVLRHELIPGEFTRYAIDTGKSVFAWVIDDKPTYQACVAGFPQLEAVITNRPTAIRPTDDS